MHVAEPPQLDLGTIRLRWLDAGLPDPRPQRLEMHPFEVLLAGDLVESVDGETTVAPGIRVVRTGGHTPGHQAVIFEGERDSAISLGDLLPTRHHLDPVRVAAVAHDPDVLALRCRPDGAIAEALRASGGSGG